MATRTISNAGGNWSATTTWVEGAVPTSADDVVATATSGNLTVNAAASCGSLDLTGYLGTFTNAGYNLSVGNSSAGKVILSAGTTMAWNTSGGMLRLVSTSDNGGAGWPLTSAGKSIRNVEVAGAGGKWVLTDALYIPYNLTITTGALDTAGFDVTVGSGFVSTGSATRALTLGSSILTFSYNSALDKTLWDVTSTGFTLSAASSTIRLTGSTAAPYNFTFAGAGLIYGNLELSGRVYYRITGNNTFHNLTASCPILYLPDNGSTTLTGVLVSNGTLSDPVSIRSYTATVTTSLVGNGGLSTGVISYTRLLRINASNGTFNGSATTDDGGNNSGWSWATIANPGSSVSHYRIMVTANNGHATYAAHIAEMQMRGVASGPDLCNGGTVGFSSQATDYEATKAFDDLDSTYWLPYSGTPAQQYLKYTFASPQNVVEYTLKNANSGSSSALTGVPKSWKFQKSADGYGWYTVDERTNQTGWTYAETRTFSVTAAEAYNETVGDSMALSEGVVAEGGTRFHDETLSDSAAVTDTAGRASSAPTILGNPCPPAGDTSWYVSYDYFGGCRYTLQDPLTVVSLSTQTDEVYGSSGGVTVSLKMAIYAVTGGGKPGALLAETAAFTGELNLDRTVTCALPLPITLDPGDYYLAILTGAAAEHNAELQADNGTTEYFRKYGNGWYAAGFQDPAQTVTTYKDAYGLSLKIWANGAGEGAATYQETLADSVALAEATEVLKDGLPGPAALWRLNILDNQSHGYADLAIGEFELRSASGGASICTGGTPSASTERYPASDAFDGDHTTWWDSDPVGAENWYKGWLAYAFPSPVSCVEYAITFPTDSMFSGPPPDKGPKSWELQQSNDGGVSWITVDARANEPLWIKGETRVYPLSDFLQQEFLISDQGEVADSVLAESAVNRHYEEASDSVLAAEGILEESIITRYSMEVADSALTADSIGFSKLPPWSFEAELSDTLSSADTVTSTVSAPVVRYNKTLTESVKVTESSRESFGKALAESLTAEDTNRQALGLLLREFVLMGGALLSNWQGNRALDDALFLVESFRNAHAEGVEDAFAAADNPIYALGVRLRDYLFLTESPQASARFYRELAETVLIAASFGARREFADTLTESAAVTETLGLALALVLRDSARSLEGLTAHGRFSRELIEALKVLDASVWKYGVLEALSDAIESGDVLAALVGIFGELAESAPAVEALDPLRVSFPVNRDSIAVSQILTATGAFSSALSDTASFRVTITLDGEIYQCWVFAGDDMHASLYSNYGFNSFASLGGRDFGCNATGIYLLEGNDDAGKAVSGGLRVNFSHMGTHLRKRLFHAFFGMIGTSAAVKVITDSGEAVYYVMGNRIHPGKGLSGVNWELVLSELDELSFIEITPVILSR